jgi:Dolichyl-phosphate-mannose-protein mannosyltransferase
MTRRQRSRPRASQPQLEKVAPPPNRPRHVWTLAVFAVLFVTLEVISYTRESATYDEPIHVTNGYFSLALQDYRVDPEHPPFLRLWSALPLLTLSEVKAHPQVIDSMTPADWALSGLFDYAHQFMYVDNDADRLLYRGRLMVVLLGLALGGIVYWWAFEWFGWTTALTTLALYTLEPNLAAHARLVTTDFGVTCFIFAAVFFLWRTIERWRPANIAGLVFCVALALTSKFSAVILAPILAWLIIAAVVARRLTAPRAAGLVVLLGVTSVTAIWAVYGFRYLPSPSAGWQYAFHADPYAIERAPTLARIAGWVDGHRLLPNVYTQGMLLSQARAQLRSAFLAGQYTEEGWWYYFPVAVALKTPLTLLLLAALGGALCVKTHKRPGIAFVIVPIAIYLGWSMTVRINIGVRHVLPIYPFLIMLAALAIHHLWARGRRYLVAAAVGLCAMEAGTAYPHTLAFFNVLAGGPSGGIAYLGDSNLDWGQDLKGLKSWMDEHRVESISLGYWGHADPDYYGINCTYLPGAPGWIDLKLLQRPRLPGYVAVSATLLQGIYAENEGQRDYYRRLLSHEPIAIIGHSIYVYYLDRQW